MSSYVLRSIRDFLLIGFVVQLSGYSSSTTAVITNQYWDLFAHTSSKNALEYKDHSGGRRPTADDILSFNK